MAEITELLAALRAGNKEADSGVIEQIYRELRLLAASYMRREREGHTLQTTGLVHEAYLRLVGQREVKWQNRTHFFGIAAQMMRRILVDHARSHLKANRAGQQRITLDEAVLPPATQSLDLVALDEALAQLATMDARQAKVVELRFFAGLTEEETAKVLEISPKTVNRDWKVARAWLYRQIVNKDELGVP